MENFLIKAIDESRKRDLETYSNSEKSLFYYSLAIKNDFESDFFFKIIKKSPHSRSVVIMENITENFRIYLSMFDFVYMLKRLHDSIPEIYKDVKNNMINYIKGDKCYILTKINDDTYKTDMIKKTDNEAKINYHGDKYIRVNDLLFVLSLVLEIERFRAHNAHCLELCRLLIYCSYFIEKSSDLNGYLKGFHPINDNIFDYENEMNYFNKENKYIDISEMLKKI